MYYLLLEAAGLRQLARIHPEWHAKFERDLNTIFSDAGFEPSMADGDLRLFCEARAIRLEPEHIAALARRALSYLQEQTENLLDAALIIDYAPDITRAAEFTRLERRMRFARDAGSVYVTDELFPALEPLVTTEQSGTLRRIVAFLGAGVSERQGWTVALADAETVERVAAALDDAVHRGPVWMYGRDTTRIAAAIHNAAAQRWITIPARSGSSAEQLAAALLSALPADPGEGAPSDPEQARVIQQMRQRLAHPGGTYLSAGWKRGEIALTFSRMLAPFNTADTRPQVAILDADAVDSAEFAAFISWLSEGDTPFCHLVAVARLADGAPDGWQTTEVERSIGDAELGAPELVNYWRTDAAIDRLPRNQRRAIYAISRVDRVFDDTLMNALFPHLGISLAERARIIKDLAHLGLIIASDGVRVPAAVDMIVNELLPRDERREIDEQITTFVIERVDNGTLYLAPALWQIIASTLEGDVRHRLFHTLVHALAGGAAFEDFDALTATAHRDSRVGRLSVASARIRLHLRDSRGPHTCTEEIERITDPSGLAQMPTQVQVDLHLSRGEYLLAVRDYAAALEEAKRAIVLNQHGGHASNAAGHLLMARIMLAQRRLNDTGHYLTFAREDHGGDIASALIARSLDAARLFLVGNLTRAAAQFSSLTEPLIQTGFSEWLVWAWFGEGRVSFELGEYRTATDQFERLRQWAERCGMDATARVAETWRTRSAMMTGVDEEPLRDYLLEELRSPESLLFAAESLTRRGAFAEAAALLEEAEESELHVDRWPRLGISWDNGFAALEDLVMANSEGSSELLRLIQAYRAWSLAQSGEPDAAIAIFYRLTRGSDGLGEDPYTGLYNYLYATILPGERSLERDDRLTVLGKSVKLVQERTSRIDDYRDKMRFLKQNSWNRQLMDAAREYNLV